MANGYTTQKQIDEILNDIEREVKTELSKYGDFGYPYYVDEEDSNLEAIYQELDGLQNSESEYIKILGEWSNDRTVIPIEWIPLIIRQLGMRVI